MDMNSHNFFQLSLNHLSFPLNYSQHGHNEDLDTFNPYSDTPFLTDIDMMVNLPKQSKDLTKKPIKVLLWQLLSLNTQTSRKFHEFRSQYRNDLRKMSSKAIHTLKDSTTGITRSRLAIQLNYENYRQLTFQLMQLQTAFQEHIATFSRKMIPPKLTSHPHFHRSKDSILHNNLILLPHLYFVQSVRENSFDINQLFYTANRWRPTIGGIS